MIAEHAPDIPVNAKLVLHLLGRMFSRRWILTTLLALAAMGVMARLGIWQLDRLAARRAFNARVQAVINLPPLELKGENLQADLFNMEYRQSAALGEFDFENQVALVNQAANGQWGVNLITPLRISGSEQAILVDRGWIPAEAYQSGDWSRYDEPGQVSVAGVLRRSQDAPDYGSRRDVLPGPGEAPLKSWNFVNVPGIGAQLPYSILPVYLQQSPGLANSGGAAVIIQQDTGSSWAAAPANTRQTGDPAKSGDAPVRSAPTLNLTEGSHQSYAMQWFAFAAILGLGYPFFIYKQENLAGRAKPAAKEQSHDPKWG